MSVSLNDLPYGQQVDRRRDAFVYFEITPKDSVAQIRKAMAVTRAGVLARNETTCFLEKYAEAIDAFMRERAAYLSSSETPLPDSHREAADRFWKAFSYKRGCSFDFDQSPYYQSPYPRNPHSVTVEELLCAIDESGLNNHIDGVSKHHASILNMRDEIPLVVRREVERTQKLRNNKGTLLYRETDFRTGEMRERGFRLLGLTITTRPFRVSRSRPGQPKPRIVYGAEA